MRGMSEGSATAAPSSRGILTDTLVICTRDRPEDLRRCLESLHKCCDLPQAILVVDSSEGSASKEVVQGVDDRLRVEYIHSEPGLTWQRNVGLELCDDVDVVHFVDDDCIVPSGYFDAVRSAFADNPDVVGAGSSVVHTDQRGVPLPAPGSRWPVVVKKVVHALTFLDAGNRQVNTAAISGENRADGPGLNETEWLPGCSMSFRLDIARMEMFNTTVYRDYSLGEDLEFSLRMNAHGRLVLVSHPRMMHTRSPVRRLSRSRLAEMDTISRMHLLRQHRHRFSRWAVAMSLFGKAATYGAGGDWTSIRGMLRGLRPRAARSQGARVMHGGRFIDA